MIEHLCSACVPAGRMIELQSELIPRDSERKRMQGLMLWIASYVYRWPLVFLWLKLGDFDSVHWLPTNVVLGFFFTSCTAGFYACKLPNSKVRPRHIFYLWFLHTLLWMGRPQLN